MSNKPGKLFVWEPVPTENISEDPFLDSDKPKIPCLSLKDQLRLQYPAQNWLLSPGNYRVIFQTKPGKPWRGNC